MKKLYILALLLFISTISSYSQTAPYVINENHNGCCGGGQTAGSSFKVLGAGQIDSIRIYPRHNKDYTATIKFYKGNGPDSDSLLYTQSFTVTGNYLGAGNDVKLIKLTSPVKVKEDSVYTFFIEGTPVRYNFSGTSGSYWDDSGESKGKAVDFMIYVGNNIITSISDEILSNDVFLQLDNSGRVLNVTNSDKKFQLNLYNTNGILITGGSNNQINLPVLSEGVYIIQLIGERESFSRKIYIKQ